VGDVLDHSPANESGTHGGAVAAHSSDHLAVAISKYGHFNVAACLKFHRRHPVCDEASRHLVTSRSVHRGSIIFEHRSSIPQVGSNIGTTIAALDTTMPSPRRTCSPEVDDPRPVG
jgi:hypothetical protein